MMQQDAMKYLVIYAGHTSFESTALLFCILHFQEWASAYVEAVLFILIT